MKINNLYEVKIREKNTYTYIYCSKCNLAPSDLQPHYRIMRFYLLPFSFRYYTMKGKHCRRPIAEMEVVAHFGPYLRKTS